MYTQSPLISIIIPVYNNELYIRKCVESILEDQYINVELILVNDGSTDGSATVCEELVLTDRRIRVYHQANMGVSAARNKGIHEAKGDWLWFVDSDDTIAKDGIQFLVGMIELYPNISCIGFGLTKIFENSTEVNFSVEYREEVLSKTEAMYLLYKPKYFPYFGFVHSKIFKREVIVKHNILFDEGIAFNEDRLFSFEFFDRSEDQVLLVTKSLYNYLINSDSTIGRLNDNYNPKHITELYAFLKMQRIAIDNGNKETILEGRIEVLKNVYVNFVLLRKFSIIDYSRVKFLRKVGWSNIKLMDIFNYKTRRTSGGCFKQIFLSFFDYVYSK